nr:PREDICTED: regucalcin-like [Linepithema humile]
MRRVIHKYVLLASVLVALVHGRRHGWEHRVSVNRVTDAFGLSEGPHWDQRTQKLYFVDITNQYIRRLDPATGEVNSAYIKHGPVGVVVTVDDTPDKLVAGSGRDVILVSWDGDENEANTTIEVLCSVDTDRNQTRINDGKVDSHGRFWLGTMANEVNGQVSPNEGTLYRIDDKLEPKTEVTPVSISNGLAWDKEDNKFYYIDSPTRQVVGYDYDPQAGTISNKKVIFDLNKTELQGVPDGMTIDTDGNLWVALFGGHHIPVYRGSDKPLINNYEPSDYYGTNGFGDFDFSRNITAKLNTTQNASALLVDLVKQYPDEIVIVSLGPLTNVARAIMLESRFLYFVKQHVIMGASINLDSEFNFKQDPEGNLIAFNDTNKPSLVIPKEAVHSVSISKEEYRDLFASLNQSIASFLYQAEKLGVEKAEYWEPSDGIAMAIALQPEITTESIETNLKPIIMGDRRGAVEIDSTKKHNAKVVKNYNVTAFKNLILEYLS